MRKEAYSNPYIRIMINFQKLKITIGFFKKITLFVAEKRINISGKRLSSDQTDLNAKEKQENTFSVFHFTIYSSKFIHSGILK